MASVEKLSIALTHEMADEVRAAVDSGDYASSSEVIREALRDWRCKPLIFNQIDNDIAFRFTRTCPPLAKSLSPALGLSRKVEKVPPWIFSTAEAENAIARFRRFQWPKINRE